MNPSVILFACGHCDTKLTVPASYAGMSDFCPVCTKTLTAPTLEAYLASLPQESSPEASRAPDPDPLESVIGQSPTSDVDSSSSDLVPHGLAEALSPTSEEALLPQSSAEGDVTNEGPVLIESRDLSNDPEAEALTRSLQEVFKHHPPRPGKAPLETPSTEAPEWSTSDLVEVFKAPVLPLDPTLPDATPPSVESAPQVEVEPLASSDVEATGSPSDLQASKALDEPLEPEPSPTSSSKGVTPAVVQVPSNQELIEGSSIQVHFDSPTLAPSIDDASAGLTLLSELTAPQYQMELEPKPPVVSKRKSFSELTKDHAPAPEPEPEPAPKVTPPAPKAEPVAADPPLMDWDRPRPTGRESLPFVSIPAPRPQSPTIQASANETVIKISQKLNVLPEGEQSIAELLSKMPPVEALTEIEKPEPELPVEEEKALSQDLAPQEPPASILEKNSGVQWIERSTVTKSPETAAKRRFRRNVSVILVFFLIFDYVLIRIFQEPIKEFLGLGTATEVDRALSSAVSTAQDDPSQRAYPTLTGPSPLLPAIPQDATPRALTIGSVMDPQESILYRNDASSEAPRIHPPLAPNPSALASGPKVSVTVQIPRLETTSIDVTPDPALPKAIPISDASGMSVEAPASEPVSLINRLSETPESKPAFDALERFLMAATWKDRLPYVWQPEKHRAEVEAYHQDAKEHKIEATSILLMAQNEGTETVPPHCIFEIRESFMSRRVICFLLLDPKSKTYQVDWDSFIEFRDDHLYRFSQAPDSPPQSFRVTIKRGHVFSKEARLHASRAPFSLGQPSSFERITAFAPNGQDIAKELVDTLGWELERTYKVRLAWKKAGETPYIEIEEIESRTWND